jgi:hypothetical protein
MKRKRRRDSCDLIATTKREIFERKLLQLSAKARRLPNVKLAEE